jgi:hypothetical protein
MFNIVKRRDFMLGQDLPTKQDAEKALDNYGKEYVVIQTDEPRHHEQSVRPAETGREFDPAAAACNSCSAPVPGVPAAAAV